MNSFQRTFQHLVDSTNILSDGTIPPPPPLHPAPILHPATNPAPPPPPSTDPAPPASTWPSSTVRGCYFHFTKATFKHLVDLGLKTEYEVEGSEIRRYYKMINALPFVPEDEVLNAWDQLRPQLPSDLSSFATYFEYTWVGSRSRDPLFSIPTWNQHDASLMRLPRSTNMAEGWHHGFNSMLSCNHPTMWRFLEALKKEQNLTRIQLGRMRQLEAPERRAAKWIRYDDRIQRLCDSYSTMNDVVNFLKTVANVC